MTLAIRDSLPGLRITNTQQHPGDPVAESRRTVLAWLMAYTADDEMKIRQMMGMVGIEVTVPHQAIVMSVRTRDPDSHCGDPSVTASPGNSPAGIPGKSAGALLDRLEPTWRTDFFCRAGDRSYVFWTARRSRSGGDPDGIVEIADLAYRRLGLTGRLLVGLGRLATDGMSLKRSLDEAETCVSLLENGVCDDSNPVQVLRAEQAHVYQLLRLVKDEAGLRSFVQQWIGRLIEHDEVRGTDLVRTLEVYLDSGGSLREAAASLYLHPRGVRYRLDRMYELLGVDSPTPDWKLTVHVAVKASRLLRASPSHKRPAAGTIQVRAGNAGMQPARGDEQS